jgi:NAD(P)-dependent dehydrogenase (short-subunit alcohol dehydrogenase family)
MDFDFTDYLIVVTGGASGVGASCAHFFAARGARVVIADRNEQAALEMARVTGGLAAAIDVAEEAQVETLIARTEEEQGPVAVLVNSAGVLQRTLPPGDLAMKDWDLVARINLRGTYVCCRAVGSRMATRRRGSIINIASVAGMRSGPLHSYVPAKAGVISLTECLAAEWGPALVRVNAVSPGFTRTPALEKGIDKGQLDTTEMITGSALGRLIEPAEIAAVVGFLASDLASAVTGVNIAVDAGYLVATPWQTYGGLRRPSEPTARAPDVTPATAGRDD